MVWNHIVNCAIIIIMIRSFYEATTKEKILALLICLALIAVGFGLGIAVSGILWC